jgi:hypothetical protein
MTQSLNNEKQKSQLLGNYNPIKETIEQYGIQMPPLVAVGDLTVTNKENEEEEIKSIKNVPLPNLGDKFMLFGNEYVVVYINAGQHRFSCDPCKSLY